MKFERVETAKEYVDRCHGGNQSAFARYEGIANRQYVQPWMKNYIVIDGVLYSPRRRLSKK